MAGEEDINSSTLNSQLSKTQTVWKEEMERNQSKVNVLQAKLSQITPRIQESSEEAKKELEVLWRRVKTTTTLLTYLESKARIMTIPHLALTSCGIKQLDGEGFIDRSGKPMSNWSRNVEFSNFDCPEVEKWIGIKSQKGVLDEQDGIYMGEILNSVQTVTDVMENLVKRVLMAECETSSEKEKVTLGQEEIKKKAIQIETMSEKLDEMDRFAMGTIRRVMIIHNCLIFILE